MKHSARAIIGRTVISIHNANPLAKVVSIVVNGATKQVLLVELQIPKKTKKYLLLRDAREINPDFVIIDSESVLADQDELVRYEEELKTPLTLFGYKVITQSGKKLGSCIDYHFDTISFDITKLILNGRMFQKILTSRHTIDGIDILSIRPRLIIVKDAVVLADSKAKSALSAQNS